MEVELKVLTPGRRHERTNNGARKAAYRPRGRHEAVVVARRRAIRCVRAGVPNRVGNADTALGERAGRRDGIRVRADPHDHDDDHDDHGVQAGGKGGARGACVRVRVRVACVAWGGMG